MANPQTENGYTKIANEIMEALAGIRIAGEARQCLDVILRKTYGFNKKEDQISLSQFSLLTKMPKETVRRGLLKLVKINIIVIKKDNDNINLYRFNKDFSTWKPLSKKIIVIKKDNGRYQKSQSALSKKGHTKETITKETITKEILSSTTNKILTPIQEIVNHFFKVKGWIQNEQVYSRWVKTAKQLLSVENNIIIIKQRIEDIGKWADNRNLDWNLDTVLKRWFEKERMTDDEIREYDLQIINRRKNAN